MSELANHDNEFFRGADGGTDYTALAESAAKLLGEGVKAVNTAKSLKGSDADCGSDPLIRITKKQKQRHRDYLACVANKNNQPTQSSTASPNTDYHQQKPKSKTLKYVLIGGGALVVIGLSALIIYKIKK